MRRRLRRKRSIAKRELHFHRKRVFALSAGRIQQHIKVLRDHHSADWKHLFSIAGTANVMATQSRDPWRCRVCKMMQKKSSTHCNTCGAHWKKVVDRDFVYVHPNHPVTYAGWEGVQWPQEWHGVLDKRSQSPRKRKPSKSPRRKPTRAPPKEPNWGGSVPSAPSAPASSQSDKAMTTLVNALRKAEAELPPDVQTALSEITLQSSQNQTKNMLNVVKKLGDAKKKLENANLARIQLHATWKTFLTDSVTRWKKHMETFAKQDADCETAIQNAKSAVQQSQAALEESTETKSEAVEISDDETVSATAARMPAAEAIKEGLKSMVDSLDTLKQKAEESIVDQPHPKKARKGSGGEDGGDSSFT